MEKDKYGFTPDELELVRKIEQDNTPGARHWVPVGFMEKFSKYLDWKNSVQMARLEEESETPNRPS